MSDLTKRLRDALKISLNARSFLPAAYRSHVTNANQLLNEADAHLSSVDQSREEWAKGADVLLAAFTKVLVDGFDECPAAVLADAALRDYFRAVPDTPGIVPVEPVAYCVYLPSMDTQEYFDDLDDLWCVDLLTNNPDAQVTPLYAQPKELTNE